jgi:hypothetical protein
MPPAVALEMYWVGLPDSSHEDCAIIAIRDGVCVIH